MGGGHFFRKHGPLTALATVALLIMLLTSGVPIPMVTPTPFDWKPGKLTHCADISDPLSTLLQFRKEFSRPGCLFLQLTCFPSLQFYSMNIFFSLFNLVLQAKTKRCCFNIVIIWAISKQILGWLNFREGTVESYDLTSLGESTVKMGDAFIIAASVHSCASFWTFPAFL